MKILNISVGGYRNISLADLKLENEIALVGLNNYGKSNVFAAINFGFSFMRGSIENRLDMMENTRAMPLNRYMKDRNFRFEVTFSSEDSGYTAVYAYEFIWAKNDGESGSQIIGESLKVKKDGFKKFEQIIKRDIDGNRYKTCLTGRCSEKIKAENAELILDKLKTRDDLYYINILHDLLSIKFSIESHMDTARMYRNSPITFKRHKKIDLLDINDLPGCFAELQRDNTQMYEMLINSFKSLFRSLSRIDLIASKYDDAILELRAQVTGKHTPFIIKEEEYKIIVVDDNLNQPVDITMMSAGAKRILVLLTSVVIANITGVSCLAIEEPENSIHPTLLQKLLEIIRDLRGNCDIVFASHSPFLIQYLDPQKIYFGLPNKRGIAVFRRISSKVKLNQICRESERNKINLGEYCFDMLNDMYLENDDYSDVFGEVDV